MRGFLKGILWGSVAAAGGLALASQLAGPAVEQAQLPKPAPEVNASAVPAVAEPPVTDTAPAVAAPTTAAAEATELAETGSAEAGADTGEDTEVAAPPEPSLPPEPEEATAVAPPATPPTAPPTALANGPATNPETSAEASQPPEPVQTQAPPDMRPADGASPSDAASIPQVAPIPPMVQLDTPRLIPPARLDEASPDTEATTMPPIMRAAEPEALLLPVPEAAPELPDPDPTPKLAEGPDGVVTGRLPRINAEALPEPEPDTPVLSLDSAPSADVRPLVLHARPFDNPAQKPLFAVLLVDDGQADLNREDLAALELPLSIVIDPLAEGASALADIWRKGGQEVVMAGSGIPQGAGPGDMEQSFQVLQERLPQSLAVVDINGQHFQNSRSLSAQIVPILAEQGRGILTLDQGLNAADQQARRDKLPAATIFRRLDQDNESAPVILRYLDRAAFKAAQDGQVVVMGRLRQETIEGILKWAVEGRAGTVAIAPISAVLLR